MSSLNLTGQVAIVTGSSSGIGKACAIYLASLGAKVVVNYVHNKDSCLEVLHAIQSQKGEAIMIQADVSKEEDVKFLFAETIKSFGKLDILVSNAGIQKDASFLKMTLAEWQQVIDVNLTGQFLCTREAANHFVNQSKENKNKDLQKSIGKIIMMSSVHDVIPWAGHVNYAASKGGIMMLMKSISQELAPMKIRINAVSPGAIKTAINKEVWSDPKSMENLLELIPYKRIGTAEDVAKAVAWLASDESDYVNGETLYIDGGMTLYPEFAGNG